MYAERIVDRGPKDGIDAPGAAALRTSKKGESSVAVEQHTQSGGRFWRKTKPGLVHNHLLSIFTDWLYARGITHCLSNIEHIQL